ncbi:MAG: hypothetical protein LQ340_005016 [Diploschistes diacapsis]|nr:MAG: hypothetical protein LQ340_005016 [Diploschistes diacapsis]
MEAVLAAIYTAIPQKDDGDPLVRYAEPGEFTRRAFYNDRLDLTQVEALGDTLAAETEQQRRLAVRGMSNVLHERYEAWRQLLLAARGELEALIDFSEDQHFDDSPAEFVKSISSQIVTLQSQISTSLTNAAKGELLRNGIRIALLGAPNAGKSSLLNQIVGREAAIVSAEAGTTRDVLETNVDIGGFFCTINDLAGIRAVSAPAKPVIVGEIEREGIRRAKESALAADIIVTVTSFKRDTAHGNGYCAFLDPEIEDILRTQIQPHQRVLHVLNKLDLLGPGKFRGSNFFTQGFEGISSSTQSLFPVSCLLAEKEVLGSTSEKSGLQSFLTGLTQELKDLTAASAVAPPDLEQATGLSHGAQLFDESLGSTERQRRLLEQCSAHLSQFLVDVDDVRARAPDSCNQIDGGEDDELDIVLAAERLRAAAECLAKVTGRGEGGDVEEVLGIVFEKFCVAKMAGATAKQLTLPEPLVQLTGLVQVHFVAFLCLSYNIFAAPASKFPLFREMLRAAGLPEHRNGAKMAPVTIENYKSVIEGADGPTFGRFVAGIFPGHKKAFEAYFPAVHDEPQRRCEKPKVVLTAGMPTSISSLCVHCNPLGRRLKLAVLASFPHPPPRHQILAPRRPYDRPKHPQRCRPFPRRMLGTPPSRNRTSSAWDPPRHAPACKPSKPPTSSTAGT